MVNSENLNSTLIVIIPIITAIIGSGFLTSDYFKKSIEPNILVNLILDEVDDNGDLIIKNVGKSPAINFTLFFLSPHTIKNITKILSTDKITITTNNLTNEESLIGKQIKIDDTYFELFIPKLIHGDGSLVDFDIIFDSVENLTKYNFKIIAKYHNGSTIGITIKGFSFEDLFNLTYIQYLNSENPTLVYFIVFTFILVPIEIFFLFFVYYILPKRHIKYKFIYHLFRLRNVLKEIHDLGDYNFEKIAKVYDEIFSLNWRIGIFPIWPNLHKWLNSKYQKKPIEFYLFKNKYQLYKLMFDLRYHLDLFKNTNNIPQKKHAIITSIEILEDIITYLNEDKNFSLRRNSIKK